MVFVDGQANFNNAFGDLSVRGDILSCMSSGRMKCISFSRYFSWSAIRNSSTYNKLLKGLTISS